MTGDQIVFVAVLVSAMAMFLWGRWRHDMVAMGALLVCVILGLVPAGEAFCRIRPSGGDHGRQRAGSRVWPADNRDRG